ncbi:MAG: ATP synthase subunit I [Chloracidobacterium sp.]|uniref:ATP synthase subunit I n=1 Tax=Chloracidobacterium validum TaxID=2821543 RepID=A0ABX8B5C3_9BACT|nr:ATP synthase subunit I [Chloracidobacterium validum]QUW02171.1 ATP synthase subunit I [Chloracidobacterium validum]
MALSLEPTPESTPEPALLDTSPVSPLATERRVRWLTCVIAAGLALAAGMWWRWGVGVGVALGGALAYLNFLWMQASLRSIVAATTSIGGKPSRWQMGKFFLRWIVIGVVIWLSIQVAFVPPVAIVCGLFALPLAVIAEALVQVRYGLDRAGHVTLEHEQ